MTASDAFDVVVVGGGSAGVAAALGSVAEGARTLLVEQSDDGVRRFWIELRGVRALQS